MSGLLGAMPLNRRRVRRLTGDGLKVVLLNQCGAMLNGLGEIKIMLSVTREAQAWASGC